ncbi:MAG: DUF3159 domain-containing protein [Microbacteriaceae bacterium]
MATKQPDSRQPADSRRAQAKAARHQRHDERLEREAAEIEQVEDRISALAGRAGIGSVMQNEQLTGADVLHVLGGVRGIIETLSPSLVFVIAYAVSRDLQLTLALSLGIAVLFVGIRVVQKSQTKSAMAGLLAAAASAAIALITGQAKDYYLMSLVLNAAYAAGMLLSIVIGWPAIGLLMGFLMGDGIAWRKNPKRFRMMVWLTLLWFGMFAIRLIVEVPLYLMDNEDALGITRILLGTPVYAVIIVLTWMMTRAVYPATHQRGTESSGKTG